MLSNALQIIGLGVAGIDPLGAIILFAAIRAKAGRSKVIAFTISTLVATVVAGVTITFLSNQLVGGTSPQTTSEPGAIWAYLEIGVALLIAYWLFRSDRKTLEKKEEKKPQAIGGSVFAYILAGIVFSVSSIIDPTFLATVVVLADMKNLFISITAFTVWTLISQFMMFTLLVAYLSGAEERLTNFTLQLWQRHKILFQNLLFGAGIIIVIMLLADSAYYFINGHYFS